VGRKSEHGLAAAVAKEGVILVIEFLPSVGTTPVTPDVVVNDGDGPNAKADANATGDGASADARCCCSF